jgi:parallel beta-helix repeat protein
MADPLNATFFVAVNGDDGWSGKLDAPNADGTDGPFATPVRARDAIREMKAKEGLKRPATVMVRGGKYCLEETLVLNSEDSGTRECPVTYTAYPGEEPVLSGGRKIAGWKPYKGKILQCELPEARGGRWRFRQLFFNGQRQVRARFPSFDPRDPLYGGWLFTEGPAEKNARRAFKYRPGTFKQPWARPREAEVFICHHEGSTETIPVWAVDEEERVITLTRDVRDWMRSPYINDPMRVPYDDNPVPINPNTAFYVENVLEELDQPGEWCLDSVDGVLYFWPPEQIEQGEVAVPVLDCLISFETKKARGASWITLSGFKLTETTTGDNMHREGNEGFGAMSPLAGQGRTYCGEALHMRGAEHCRVEGNHFYAVGGNAVYVEDYNTRNIIRDNEISEAGAIGICLIGTNYACPIRHYPFYNKVVDNHIHHCGVLNKYVAGVFLGLCDGNTIAHNLIEHVPHHGINLGNSQYGRNIIEYNEIRNTCLETSDNGAINAWGEDPWGHVTRDAERSGHIIRYNLIADTRGWRLDKGGGRGTAFWMESPIEGCTHGIYLDNYTSNCIVYGNTIVRSGSVGVYIQCGKNNIVENNIIVDTLALSHLGGWWQPQMAEPSFMTGNRFCRNIFYRTRGIPPIIHIHVGCKDEPLSDAVAESDYNVFFSATGGEFTITESSGFMFPDLPHPWPFNPRTVSFEEWRKTGFDTHSLVADPMFVDPEKDDYRLQPGSPALELGFAPIDTGKAGLTGRKGSNQ